MSMNIQKAILITKDRIENMKLFIPSTPSEVWIKEETEEWLKYIEKILEKEIKNEQSRTFDSKKEADYYCDLKLRLQCGDIRGFCLQPVFILAPGLKYKADFIVFYNDGTSEIIDTKGFKTKEYIAKKKVFEDKYNLKIKEE